jgi:hypothetical protein
MHGELMGRVHPDEVLRSLEGLAKHPVKRRNLQTLHQVCTEQAKLSQGQFSYSHIGKLLETEGVMTAKALSNPQSADYRKLIDAWREYIKPKNSLPLNDDDQSWIMRISDPAIRQIVQLNLSELHKLRGQTQAIRKHMKPVIVYSGSAVPPVQSVEAGTSSLSRLERTAILAAIDDEHLTRNGLSKGPRGEIRKENGAILFERGFVDGLRKLLQES